MVKTVGKTMIRTGTKRTDSEEVKRERSKSVEKKEPPEKQRKVLAVKDVDNITRLSSSEDDWEPPTVPVQVAAPAKPAKEKVAAGVKRKASKDAREAKEKKRRSWRGNRDSSDESDTEVSRTLIVVVTGVVHMTRRWT